MKRKLYRFMQGRYGIDSLSNFLLVAGMILVILNIFVRNWFITLLVWILLVFSYMRILSKNYARCSAQNEWFLKKTRKLRDFFYRQNAHMRIRRTHHIYSCPGCGQKIKIPRGKGKIVITCPKCRIEFTKKS